jgi:hypothetical protein
VLPGARQKSGPQEDISFIHFAMEVDISHVPGATASLVARIDGTVKTVSSESSSLATSGRVVLESLRRHLVQSD